MRGFWTGLLILIIIVGGGFAIWWFASGQNNNNNSTNTNTPTISTPNANQQIKTNWTKFFSGSTPAQQKVGLLQNGQEFAQVIQAQAQTPTAKATTATVSNVAVNGNTATVTYTIDINGKPALSNQKGQAIYTNGVWKVSDTDFCALLKLGGQLPPNCPGGSTQKVQPSSQTQTQPQTSQ